MKKFPGVIKSEGSSRRYFLTEEQSEWLTKWYPSTENRRLAKAMGVCEDTMKRFARGLGLRKSPQGLKSINRRRLKAMAAAGSMAECYERKRGQPVSAATQKGLQRHWERVREGLADSPIDVLRKKDRQRYAELMERKSAERKELFRKERLRMLYGLSQRTKLSQVVLFPYTQSQRHHRCNALKRGYLLDVDCSEGAEGRYVIYYDNSTRRSGPFEENLRRDGFRILPDA